MFADLFTDVGRRSVPPMIVAVVMVLQRIEGCSDREAVDRFAFDARWKYAAGGLLKVADAELESRLRAVLARDDDYGNAGKPSCDYDDPQARVELVDALAT